MGFQTAHRSAGFLPSDSVYDVCHRSGVIGLILTTISFEAPDDVSFDELSEVKLGEGVLAELKEI